MGTRRRALGSWRRHEEDERVGPRADERWARTRTMARPDDSPFALTGAAAI